MMRELKVISFASSPRYFNKAAAQIPMMRELKVIHFATDDSPYL